MLYGNYPNPFNASTIIKYNLDHDCYVKLSVYDILGKNVAALIDEHQPAGTHQVIWNGDNLPSGVYFYRIESDNRIETKKMILLR